MRFRYVPLHLTPPATYLLTILYAHESRKLAKSRMKSHEVPLTLTSFPRLGATGVFTDPYYPPGGGVARSLFLPDEVTNQHVRFPCVFSAPPASLALALTRSPPRSTLTANIRRRRGSKVAINMPIYFDENTPRPFVDPTVPRDRNLWPEDANAREGAALDDHIYMDAMGFGMGCCCLQITFQACSVGEARRMYDAFVPVGPVMVRPCPRPSSLLSFANTAEDLFVWRQQLALSAAAPIFRGWLSDVDCRWDVIAGSVDDRTPEERGKEVRPSLRPSAWLLADSPRAYTAAPARSLRHSQVAVRFGGLLHRR